MSCNKGCQKSTSNSQSPCKHEDCWYNKKYGRNSSEKRKRNSKTDEKCQVFKRDQSPTYSSSFASDDSSPNRSGDEECSDPKYLSSNKLMLNAEKEEARYAQFVYDITQDIVRKGLYTDKEFKEVFRRHLEKNAGILDKHRMLYEIYQLKISLNIDEDDDEEQEHLANYIYSKRFPTISKPKPPTPPKTLDDNKVMEKLKNYQQLMDKHPGSTTCNKKSVVLVDANPEILITERDILQTLIETNVEPNQAEHICRSLFHKSKDTSLCQMEKNETEDATMQYARANNGKIKQSPATKKKRNVCTLCNARTCFCASKKELMANYDTYKYRDVSSVINSKPQSPVVYEKLLNVVSQCSQVTRSILEQSTRVQRLKSKDETYRKSEERQHKIRQAEIAGEKMAGIQLADDIQTAEMKNASATSASTIFNVTPENKGGRTESSKDLSSYPKQSNEAWESLPESWKIKKPILNLVEEKERADELPSIINEDDENYDDDCEEEISTEVTYSREFHDESKSDRNEATHVDEEVSVQYSESFDDQKDSASASKDRISDTARSSNEKHSSQDELEDRRYRVEIMPSNKCYKSKPNCKPSCKRNLYQNCNTYCKYETETRDVRPKRHLRCPDLKFERFSSDMADSN